MMSHSMPLSLQYLPSPPAHHTQYMLAPHPQHAHIPGHVHLVSGHHIAHEPAQRKRPKYTRSKTGCLTCRLKKVKCDESKPSCQRCTHAARDCTWPEPAPPKKKAASKKSSQRKHSPAESSSHVSDSSSTSHDVTLSAREPNTTSPLGNGSERRYSEPQMHATVPQDALNARRQTLPSIAQGHYGQAAPVSSLSAVPEYSPGYSSSANGSYGTGQGSAISGMSSRTDSRPSTANSLPPSRFPPQMADSNGQYNMGLSNANTRGAYMSQPRWDTPTNRTDAAPYGHYHSQSVAHQFARSYGQEYSNRS